MVKKEELIYDSRDGVDSIHGISVPDGGIYGYMCELGCIYRYGSGCPSSEKDDAGRISGSTIFYIGS